MALMCSAKLVRDALTNGYAVPHFNICNLETVLAVAEVASKRQSPVIFGVHPVESAYAGRENLFALIASEIRSRDLVAAIHLDHSPSYEEVVRCIRAGFTSVMFDGSTQPLEENIATTARVVEVARPIGVSVEAEVGTIGSTAEYGGEIDKPHLADPVACGRMAATGIDALAVAIGNAHGVYIEKPELDFERLSQIRQHTDIPLVLHGGSGIPVDQVQRAIGMGIAKFNVGTAIHVAFKQGIEEGLAENPKSHDIMKILSNARGRVKETVSDYIDIAMSAGRGR